MKKQNLYFTERQIDLIADMKILRQEYWEKAKSSERLAALKECEARISSFENRPKCSVKRWNPKDPNFLGFFKEGKICISNELLKGKSSSEALSVLVEESHHAFQEYALNNPGFYTGIFMKEWEENKKNYHLPPRADDPPEVKAQQWKAYNEQPLEKTAKEAAEAVVRELQRTHSMQRSQEELEKELKDGRFSYNLDVKKDKKTVVLDQSDQEKLQKISQQLSSLSEEEIQRLIHLVHKEITSSKQPESEREQPNTNQHQIERKQDFDLGR